MSANELQARRRPVMRAFDRLKRQAPGLEIWDPFSLLCRGEVCSPVNGDKPLVSDGDHLTGYANDLLSPNFREFIGVAHVIE